MCTYVHIYIYVYICGWNVSVIAHLVTGHIQILWVWATRKSENHGIVHPSAQPTASKRKSSTVNAWEVQLVALICGTIHLGMGQFSKSASKKCRCHSFVNMNYPLCLIIPFWTSTRHFGVCLLNLPVLFWMQFFLKLCHTSEPRTYSLNLRGLMKTEGQMIRDMNMTQENGHVN